MTVQKNLTPKINNVKIGEDNVLFIKALFVILSGLLVRISIHNHIQEAFEFMKVDRSSPDIKPNRKSRRAMS